MNLGKFGGRSIMPDFLSPDDSPEAMATRDADRETAFTNWHKQPALELAQKLLGLNELQREGVQTLLRTAFQCGAEWGNVQASMSLMMKIVGLMQDKGELPGGKRKPKEPDKTE
jgi:hypothetical protein